MQFTSSTPLPKNYIPICVDAKKEYSNASLQTNRSFGAFDANTSTKTEVIGANQTFLQPGNNFRPPQTQRRDLRDKGCLLPSTALRLEDSTELLREKRRDFKKQLWAREQLGDDQPQRRYLGH